MNHTGQRARARGTALWVLAAATVAVSACAQSGDSGSAAASDAPAGAVEQPAQTETSSSQGSVSPPDRQAEPVDMQLAARGDELFARKGCVACHKIGEGRLVGPDLMGVTERRSYEWIHAMVTAPDSMLQNDSTAKALFAEYFTPMPDQKVGPEEGRAIYEYLRARTEGVMQSSSVSGSDADVAMAGHQHRRGAGMGRQARMHQRSAATDDEPGATGGRRAGRGPRAGHGRRHRHHQGTSF